MTRRAPKKQHGFSWGRFPMGETGIVCYRLFRRDHRGVVHITSWTRATTCRGPRSRAGSRSAAGCSATRSTRSTCRRWGLLRD